MTDLSAQPQAQPQPQAPVTASLASALKAAPELGKSPGLAVGVATSGGDVQTRAQGVAHATNVISDTNAHTQVNASVGGDIGNALSWFGNHVASAADDTLHSAEHAGSWAMREINKPMAFVQHEYRYLHDVEASHGRLAAILEGLGIAAGAGAGLVASGGSLAGAALGAEGATALEGQVFYKDSWDRTANGATYTDPHTHQPVSLGRDIANLIGVQPGTVSYRLTSGLVDGIFDLNVGGPEVLGLVGQARSAEGLGGLLASRWGGTAVHTLGDAVGGAGVTEPSEIDRIYAQYPSVRRAFADIADKSAGDLAATPAYGGLRQIFPQLGAARTPEEVGQVFKEVLRTQELAMTDRLPSLSFTRLHFGQALREWAENMPTEGRSPFAMIGRQTQRFTALPTAFDTAAREMSLHEFDPSDPIDDGTVGVYRMARFTESRRVAASIADAYANAPDLQSKIRIFRNLSMNTLLNFAGFRGLSRDQFLDAWELANPDTRDAMAKALDDAISGGMFGKEAVYGLDDQGRNISLVRDANSNWQYGAAIWENQTGKLRFMNLNEARRAGAMMRGARNVLGRLDDFGYDHITQGIFKPIVLLTPSYALHISLAEVIPNALREGTLRLARAGIAINMAKLGTKIGDAEDAGVKAPAVAGLAWRLVTGTMDKLPTRMSAGLERRLQLAAQYIEYNGGEAEAAGLSSGHAYEAEVANRDEQSVSLLRRSYFDSPMKVSKTFGIMGSADAQYIPAWQAALREIANDPSGQRAAQEMIDGARRGESVETAAGNATKAVARYLRSLSSAEQARFLRSDDRITAAVPGFDRAPDEDAIDEFARVKVAALRGAVRGSDRSIDGRLLKAIAEGRTLLESELRDIPVAARPSLVKARQMVPSGSSAIQRIANVGFRRVLNPMVNFISRQPIGFNEFERQWAMEEPLVNAGVKDYDEAMNDAMSRTVNRVLRNVHNLTDRTQWTVTMRNWAPFYFAQEQAYRRMGRLLAENPRAFRQYQLMISNIANVGQVFQGKNGRGYFVIPGTGWLSGAASVPGALLTLHMPITSAQPIGMGWNLSASSVIFPLSAGVRPDLGPLAAIPTQAIYKAVAHFLPTTIQADGSAVVDTILGPAASESLWSNLVPNTILQRILEGAMPSFNERSFNSTAMQVLQTLDYENKIPAPTASPWQFQKFLDRWRSQTAIMYGAKAVVGAVTPVSPELQVQNWGLPAELQNDINKAGSLNKGISLFLSKHPDAQPFTVWQSASTTGVTVPDSIAAEKWIDENMGIIHSSHGAALLLLPPGTNAKYNQNVYNEQIAQGIRSKWFPGEVEPNGQLSGYLQQLYINAGNQVVLGDWYPQYEKQIKGLTGQQKYQAELNWQQTLTDYAAKNPIWGLYWNSNATEVRRGQLINNMKTLLASPQAPKTEIADETRILLRAYDDYQNQLAQGTADGFVGETQSEIDQTWKDNLEATAAAHPELVNVITGLFMSVTPPGAVPATAPGENAGAPGTFNAQNWRAA